jgi:thiamine pyrophosphate-dependent acetolactate synthase large subunit-like protein
MMARTVAHAVVQRLSDWGVCRLFGYSDDGINTLFGALREGTGGVEFIQARHEESAAFMATAHHRYTGQLAGCVSTQGPGAVHLLNGLYDARLDHTPVVAIVGQQSSSVRGPGRTNNDLNEVTWEQREMEGDARSAASQDIPDFDYAKFAELLGFRGIRVDTADQAAAAWDEALSASGPVLIDARTDPDVPLLAPQVESTQAEHMYQALGAEGDPAQQARQLVAAQLGQQPG